MPSPLPPRALPTLLGLALLCLPGCSPVTVASTAADFDLDTRDLSFDPMDVGCEAESKRFVVSNPGTATLEFNVRAIASVDDAFTLSGEHGAGDHTLGPGRDRAFEVTFRPSHRGTSAGSILVQPGNVERADDATVVLSGTGRGDDDGDGWSTAECAGDCDDGDPAIHPGAEEVCDGVDNDCDGGLLASEADADADGFPVCAGDCDDGDPAVNPDADEVPCDGVDNDCDGVQAPDPPDQDGDGWTECAGDCDDGDPAVHPGADEAACDGVDTDCDGTLHPEEVDDDGDGWTECAGDCDDTDPALNLDDADGDGVTTCDAVFYGTAGQGTNNGWTCDDVCTAGGGLSVDWTSQAEQETYCLSLSPSAQVIVATPHNDSYPLFVTQNGVDQCDVNADGQKSQGWAGNGTAVYGDLILCRCER